MDVRYDNALAELNDCTGHLLQLALNVLAFRISLHLGLQHMSPDWQFTSMITIAYNLEEKSKHLLAIPEIL